MKYTVSFVRMCDFTFTAEADTPDQAMADAVQAYYRGELTPVFSGLTNFSAEPQP